MVHIPLDGPHRPRRRTEGDEIAEMLVALALAIVVIVAFFLVAYAAS